jgi:hypothetical protein
VLPPAVGPYVAATAYGGPDTSILSQTFALPEASKLGLSLYLFYAAEAPMAVPTPDTLFVNPFGEADNQQVRVDVLKPNAPLESLSPNDILATLYASPAGGPEKLEPTLLTADLTAFAGQTVTLRIASAASEAKFEVGVGDIALAVTPPLPPPSPPAPPVEEPPSTPVSDGVDSPVAHNLVHRLKSGGGLLGVRLPAAGTLIVSDARRKAAVASTFAARRTTAAPKPVLVRTASVVVDHAQTVHVPLRPTATANRLLNRDGRVPFRLQLTFDSARGAVSTATFKGVLIKRTPRPRRSAAAPARR